MPPIKSISFFLLYRKMLRRTLPPQLQMLLQHRPVPPLGVAVLTPQATTGVGATLIIILASQILVRYGACVCMLCVYAFVSGITAQHYFWQDLLDWLTRQ